MRISFYKQKVQRFIKVHWFTLALISLLFFAIAKLKMDKQADRPRHNPVITQPEMNLDSKPQKFTESEISLGEGSLLGEFSNKNTTKHLPELSQKTSVAFLKRFGRVVVSEQEKYGVPASVLLATAYVNSFAGTRDCALHANNYYALSCANVRGEQYQENGICKLKVKTAWESFRAFNLLLAAQPWIKQAKSDAGTNWEAWLPILAQHQISDVENFEKEARAVILKYNLQDLDRP